MSRFQGPWQRFPPAGRMGDCKKESSTGLPQREPGQGVRVALLEVLTMPDAKYFARKAERCRQLLEVARVPDVIEQLRLWAAEFEAEARNSAQRKQHRRGSSSML